MISLDEVRSTVIETIKNLHITNYPTIPINYPNKFVVDLENFAGTFFVTVSVNYGGTLVATDITGTNAEVYGTVTVSTVFKTNTGKTGPRCTQICCLVGCCLRLSVGLIM